MQCIASETVELRHSATLSTDIEAFNGVCMWPGEPVTVLGEQVADEGVRFFNIKVGHAKGWVKAKYVK